jgi:creatinine amidohydrolase
MGNNIIHRHIEMKWPEFKEFVKKTDFAILPVAALEQHGPHLPFGSDVYIANGIAERVAEKTGALLMETLCYTPSFSLRYFPGTIHVSDENLVRMILDIVESMYRHGIKTIYVLVGHVGAAAACKDAERKLLLNSEARIVNMVMMGMNEAVKAFCESKRWHSTYIHAEEFETSCVLAVRPDLVDMSKAVKDYPEIDPLFGPVSIPWSDFTNTGVIGDATLATPEKGKAMLDFMAEKTVELIEIHRKELSRGRKFF